MKLAIFNTHTPEDSFACELSPPGCTLGRGPDNTIVLADPKAQISLIQAIIKIQNDTLSISNMGQQPIYINAESLSFTREQALFHDDQIRIGHYLILCDFANNSSLNVSSRSTQNLQQAEPAQRQPTSENAPPPLTVLPMSRGDERHHPGNQPTGTTVLPMPGQIAHYAQESSSITEPQAIVHDDWDDLAIDLGELSETSNLSSQTMGADETPKETTPAETTPTEIATEELTPALSTPQDIATQKTLGPVDHELTSRDSSSDINTPQSSAAVATETSLLATSTSSHTAHSPSSNEETTSVAELLQTSKQEADKPTTVTEAFEDPFADLLSGPGVVPVGADIDLHQVNPFEMASAISRNSANPLELVQAQGLEHQSTHGEILSIFAQDGTEQDKKTIFTDATPSTVRQESTAQVEQEADILDILHTLSYEELVRK